MSKETFSPSQVNLHNPDEYHAFIAERKANHQPIPKERELQKAGHHWLKRNMRASGSADEGAHMVAQWSPTCLCWYRSNEIATTAKPLLGDGLMSGWDYIGPIPLPEPKPEG